MRRIILLLCGFLAYQTMNAESVSKSEALRKAQSFMPGKHFVESPSAALARGEASSEAFYVFNADNNGGYVIVSGDDRTTEILGYSKTGNLDMDRLPENLKWWLDGYVRQIKALGTSVKPVKTAKTRGVGESKEAIAPLIQTKWSQDYPFNKMCPDKNGLDWRDEGFDIAHLMTDDQNYYHCVTGCVATAMAQVMYYYKYPDDCGAIPQYETFSNSWNMKALPATTFKWDKMKKEYKGNETDESADAVAELFRYCGQAVEMDYDLGGSSASVSPYHMAHYFGFGKNAKDVQRYNFSLTDWEHMIYEEVYNGRPVLYGGSSNTGGHMFIVDGYDENGLFHMNWGWGGMSDGYYVLSLANPDDLGAGGGTNKDGYSWKQHAIIGLKQNDGETENPRFYAGFYSSLEQSEFCRGAAVEDFKDIEILGYVYYQYNDPNIQDGEYTCTFKVGWGLYQNGNLLKVLGISEYNESMYNCVENNIASFSFGSGLADGKYQFRPVYQIQNSEEWQLCETRDIVFVDAVISDNRLTLRQSSGSVYTSNIEIQDVTYFPSALEEGKPVEVTVTLKNNGDSFQEIICFWDGNQRASLVCGSVESGKTGEVKLHITPNNSGNITFRISTDAAKTLSSANVVWTDQVTVSAPKPQQLSATATTPGLVGKVLTGTTLKVNTLVTNDGPNKYENSIVLRLFKNTEDPSSDMIGGPLVATKNVMATVECGETKEVNFVIKDLDPENEYFYNIYYLSEGNGVLFPNIGNLFSPTAQTAILGDIDGDNGVDDEDLDAIVGYIMAGVYEKKAALNNDNKVNAADIVEFVKK